MIVELHGAQFKNKGSELMLRTVIAELTLRVPSIQFAVSPSIGSYQKRSELQLLQLAPPRSWMGSEKFQTELRNQKLLSPILSIGRISRRLATYGIVPIGRVDALVDLSGFAFSDQWGNAPIRDYVHLAKYYKEQDKPVIMLPQAFGPFGNAEIREQAQRLVCSADLIYARDETSLRHLREFNNDHSHVKKAPDMTLFYPKTLKSVIPAEKALYSCIIPNIRMLKQGKDKWGGRYEDVLVYIGNVLDELGEKVCLLVHDTSGKDAEIAHRVRDKLQSTPEIVRKNDPVDLKNFISKSHMVVTSRYHGAIASFAKGIPSLCLGWSHKYEMLYDDFECSDHIINYNDRENKIRTKLAKIIKTNLNNEIRENILKVINDMKSSNKTMWKEIVYVLGK